MRYNAEDAQRRIFTECEAPDGNRHVVSTVYRQSSAMVPDLWYFETMTWALNPDGTLGGIVEQSEAATFDGAQKVHTRLVERVKAGFPPEPEEVIP